MVNGKVPSCGYVISQEGNEEVMKVNCINCNYCPSIEDNTVCMAKTIDKLVESPSVARIIFSQSRNYDYGYDQTQTLIEIANLYSYLVKQKKLFNLTNMGYTLEYPNHFSNRLATVQYIALNLLRSDPIGAYVELLRTLREEKISLRKERVPLFIKDRQVYISLLEELKSLFDRTRLVTLVTPYLEGYQIGDRSVYRMLFRPSITPNFMFTRLMADPPLNGEQLDMYKVKGIDIAIYKIPGEIKYLYHVTPPEFKISEEKYELLDLARNVLSEHKPRAEEFLDPDRMRKTFFNIGRDMLQELAESRRAKISFEEIEELARILVRYTVGFGLIEILLRDPKIQDISINGPIGQTPIYIIHQDYEECMTNIIPSSEDGESWATKLRLTSGRPLDEANPVLDTELLVPGARARVAAITRPLSPVGLAYSLRRHRDNPWTLPLFIKNRMITPLAAGLISFLIDGGRTLLFAGTRSGGKTSMLSAIMVEIMRKYRVITVEDSVTGDSEILIKKAGKIEKTTIGELIDSFANKYGYWYKLVDGGVLGNYEDIEILSKDKTNKIKWARPTQLMRHKVNKKIYEIKTRTGKIIKVTEDHSLFSLDNKAKVTEVKSTELSKGVHIATPRRLLLKEQSTISINLLDYLERINKGFVIGENLKEFIKENYYEIKQLAKEHCYLRSCALRWLRKGMLPIEIIKDLNALSIRLKQYPKLYFKTGNGAEQIPLEIKLNNNLLTLIGIWLADGCYDKNSIIFSTFDNEDREIVNLVANSFNFKPKLHSDGGSFMINSASLKFLFRDIFELRGNAYTKKIPNWVFNLSKGQIACILKGLFSGDGHVSNKEIKMPLSSLQLLKDVQTLLLGFEIRLRIGKLRKDKTYDSSISTNKEFIRFKNQIGLLQDYKNKNLEALCNKVSTNDCTDVIPLNLELKRKIKSLINNEKIFSGQDYIIRDNDLGREKLSRVLSQVQIRSEEVENLKLLNNSDIFWDEILDIKLLDAGEIYVYDLSVPECESFICNNIIAHNTLELPVKSLKDLGYNIQPLKVRSALTSAGNELSADEGIRTSLRMGDSCLIVGEVRSIEAKALYEAMRIGALANVVAGTIHGASPYGVFDRVVNDLQVPKTSFKATDIILVANPIKSPDGLRKWRRITQITEVRKQWEDDPLKEKGFVDLMKYNPVTDMLEPTDDLINGNSEVLKDIAGNVKDWAGDWDSLWGNIILRTKMRENLVNMSDKLKRNDLLEADFVIKANDESRIICNEVKEDTGGLDIKKILFLWNDWLKKEVKLGR